jgi:hypothetical protein
MDNTGLFIAIFLGLASFLQQNMSIKLEATKSKNIGLNELYVPMQMDPTKLPSN